MPIRDLIAALIVALILSALFALATRRGGRRTGLFWLFLIIFLATWSGGVWFKPLGPAVWGVHWLTFLLVGVFVAIALAALTYRRRPPRGREETLEMLDRMEEEKVIEEATYITLSLFFWMLLAALVIAIAFRYLL